MAVIGASPVTFISEDTEPGVMLQVPLSVLTITSGAVDSSAWSPPTPGNTLKPNDTAILKSLLASLLARGLISAPP